MTDLLLRMELLEGETLRELIASRSLDGVTALALAVQVADVVDAAYGKAIIHPDIKPANIFVTATLADLGLVLSSPSRAAAGKAANLTVSNFKSAKNPHLIAC